MDTRKKEIDVLKISGEGKEKLKDYVVQESPLTIFLNDQEFVTLLCTPEKQDYLTLGFLRSEGLIKGREDVLSLEVDEENGTVTVETREPGKLSEKLFGKRTITSGCGKGTIFYHVLDSLTESPINTEIYLSPEDISRLMKDLQGRADLFKTTGGVHSSALGTKEGILSFCEDIGRHNAVDKLIGECIAKDVSLEDKLLITSGRLSSEILLKAAKIGIPILLSRAAPTALSVELGQKLGVTMVGFIRGKRMNVYAGEWRIKED
ncbi:formate dehydrogenase accessory sulfurtransferase FdhD [Candidatus Contubernalis alkaliaceticus]|uniref:formate dehydrogenase accessory sulfurtransferase FdhD n=1 Tax=Candidatus Contubernalis alkaliaceticus TaxID=338645 RepID=UPI001F4C2B27|nr:formate dehydrogenase accessory sulfurtransferase FdhD [Candidatus Contubernalis alkalaceticus]UNC91482.1 formate dehydrogenase accessory sulfurtransferase FdhD [Candidatus Contubernalis alkalaceticus]